MGNMQEVSASSPRATHAADRHRATSIISIVRHDKPCKHSQMPLSLALRASGFLHTAGLRPPVCLLRSSSTSSCRFLLLRGRVWLVRHSRYEGFEPTAPQLLSPGQSLCEAALVAAGRRSDVVVRVDEPPQKQNQEQQQQHGEQQGEQQQGEGSQEAALGEGEVQRWAKALAKAGKRTKTGAAVDGDISDIDENDDGDALEGGEAVFAVITRAAWNDMCARAPVKVRCGRGLCNGCWVNMFSSSEHAYSTPASQAQHNQVT